jgi:thioesterase domain-containing protein
MKPIRVVLLAADSRLFRSIRILTQYAALIADGLFIQPDDIIGGISFGGMLAEEIARQRRVAGKVIR